MIRDRITTNTITAERQEKSPNGVAGISWPVYAILHYLQKHQPICRKLRLLFNQRVISQTVKIGASKVHKHIHTLLCPAKLSFFSGRNSIKTTSSSVFHLCINQFQRCPSPPPPPPPPLGNRGTFAHVGHSHHHHHHHYLYLNTVKYIRH